MTPPIPPAVVAALLDGRLDRIWRKLAAPITANSTPTAHGAPEEAGGAAAPAHQQAAERGPPTVRRDDRA